MRLFSTNVLLRRALLDAVAWPQVKTIAKDMGYPVTNIIYHGIAQPPKGSKLEMRIEKLRKRTPANELSSLFYKAEADGYESVSIQVEVFGRKTPDSKKRVLVEKANVLVWNDTPEQKVIVGTHKDRRERNDEIWELYAQPILSFLRSSVIPWEIPWNTPNKQYMPCRFLDGRPWGEGNRFVAAMIADWHKHRIPVYGTPSMFAAKRVKITDPSKYFIFLQSVKRNYFTRKGRKIYVRSHSGRGKSKKWRVEGTSEIVKNSEINLRSTFYPKVNRFYHVDNTNLDMSDWDWFPERLRRLPVTRDWHQMRNLVHDFSFGPKLHLERGLRTYVYYPGDDLLIARKISRSLPEKEKYEVYSKIFYVMCFSFLRGGRAFLVSHKAMNYVEEFIYADDVRYLTFVTELTFSYILSYYNLEPILPKSEARCAEWEAYISKKPKVFYNACKLAVKLGEWYIEHLQESYRQVNLIDT